MMYGATKLQKKLIIKTNAIFAQKTKYKYSSYCFTFNLCLKDMPKIFNTLKIRYLLTNHKS